ncbi:hypothetical protein PO902_11485 [Planococcus maritimus]|nr:hypothetical protein [Planococcus sp. SK3692]MDE4085652.1 hypothetical protein [Planococcus maritimus]
MKRVGVMIWLLAVLMVGVVGATGWPLLAGLILLPIFFIGKPWHRSFTKNTADRK